MTIIKKPKHLSQVLIYDPQVDQMSVLLEGIDQDVEVIALDAHANSVEKINEILMRPELQRLDILAHGEPGAVLLGGQRLDSLSWPSHISASHSSNRETPLQINFWSCRTGEGETGMKVINTVAQTSNAFVNAASGFVGHRELGGSWDLDASAKPVAPFSVQAREGLGRCWKQHQRRQQPHNWS